MEKVAAGSLVNTPEGEFWVPPMFMNDIAPPPQMIKTPYWTTGIHCKEAHCCGRDLTEDEIGRFLGQDALEWWKADQERYASIYRQSPIR